MSSLVLELRQGPVLIPRPRPSLQNSASKVEEPASRRKQGSLLAGTPVNNRQLGKRRNLKQPGVVAGVEDSIDKFKCDTTEWFARGSTTVPLRLFEDPLFRARDAAMYNAGFAAAKAGLPSKPPIIGVEELKRRVEARAGLFRHVLKGYHKMQLAHSRGNPYVHGQGDHVKLANKYAFLAQAGSSMCGLRLANGDLCCETNVVCEGFAHVPNKTDAIGAKQMQATTSLAYGAPTYASVHTTGTFDGAAQALATMSKVIACMCSMHGFDKPAQAAIGRLTKSRARVVQNPFPLGQAFEKRAKNVGSHFNGRQSKADSLQECCKMVGVRYIKFRTSNNITRMNSFFIYLDSVMRMLKGINLYATKNPDARAVHLSSEDMAASAEWWAILVISMKLPMQSQVVMRPVANFWHPHKVLAIREMRKESLHVPQPDKMETDGRWHMKLKKVADFTPLGKATLRRFQVEMENRCCGTSNLHEPDGIVTPELNLLDGLAILLGPQSCWCSRAFHVPGTDSDGKDDPADTISDPDLGDMKMNHHFLKRKLMRLATRWVKVGNQYEVKTATVAEKAKAERERTARAAQRKRNKNNAMMAYADPGVSIVDVSPDRDTDHTPAASDTDPLDLDHNAASRDIVQLNNQYDEYVLACVNLPWEDWMVAHCKKVKTPCPPTVLPLHTYDLPVAPILRALDKLDGKNNKFGPFLAMCMHSEGSICRPAAESWSEAINSAGKRVLNESNSRMSPKLAENMVILRMSNRYIAHMKKCHPDVCKFDMSTRQHTPVAPKDEPAVALDVENGWDVEDAEEGKSAAVEDTEEGKSADVANAVAEDNSDDDVEDPVGDMEDAMEARDIAQALVPIGFLLN